MDNRRLIFSEKLFAGIIGHETIFLSSDKRAQRNSSIPFSVLDSIPIPIPTAQHVRVFVVYSLPMFIQTRLKLLLKFSRLSALSPRSTAFRAAARVSRF